MRAREARSMRDCFKSLQNGGFSPRLVSARNGRRATSPTIRYRTTISTNPAATWGCETVYEISSLYHGRTGEREVKPGAKPAPSQTRGKSVKSHNVPRNQVQTTELGPQLCQHPTPLPPMTRNLTVCHFFILGISSDHLSMQRRSSGRFR